MKPSIIRSAVVAVAAVALLAGCSSSDDADSTPTAQTTTEAASAGADAEVVDVTHLLLPTAAETLGLRDIESEAKDEAGNAVETTGDEAATWVVVSQDPQTGLVKSGEKVTLVVKKINS